MSRARSLPSLGGFLRDLHRWVFRDEEPAGRGDREPFRARCCSVARKRDVRDCGYVSVRVPLVIRAFPAGTTGLRGRRVRRGHRSGRRPVTRIGQGLRLAPCRGCAEGSRLFWPEASIRTTWPTRFAGSTLGVSTSRRAWKRASAEGRSTVRAFCAGRPRCGARALRHRRRGPYDWQETVELHRRADAPARSERTLRRVRRTVRARGARAGLRGVEAGFESAWADPASVGV